jgi:hypothetical protein
MLMDDSIWKKDNKSIINLDLEKAQFSIQNGLNVFFKRYTNKRKLQVNEVVREAHVCIVGQYGFMATDSNLVVATVLKV